MGNWAGKWFIINAADDGQKPGGAAVIKKKKAPSTFELVPADKDGIAIKSKRKKVHHYTIKFNRGALSEYWVGAKFFPEGAKEPPAVLAAQRLAYSGPSPSVREKINLNNLVASARPQLLQTAGTRRLRTIIDKDGNPEFLYLYKVAKAFKKTVKKKTRSKTKYEVVLRDLLIISLVDPTAPPNQPNATGHESGTGSGGKFYP